MPQIKKTARKKGSSRRKGRKRKKIFFFEFVLMIMHELFLGLWVFFLFLFFCDYETWTSFSPHSEAKKNEIKKTSARQGYIFLISYIFLHFNASQLLQLLSLRCSLSSKIEFSKKKKSIPIPLFFIQWGSNMACTIESCGKCFFLLSALVSIMSTRLVATLKRNHNWNILTFIFLPFPLLLLLVCVCISLAGFKNSSS